MNLKMYIDKKVNILAINGKSFRGQIIDYFFPDDNETEEESIVMKTSNGGFVEFNENDIEEIAIID